MCRRRTWREDISWSPVHETLLQFTRTNINVRILKKLQKNYSLRTRKNSSTGVEYWSCLRISKIEHHSHNSRADFTMLTMFESTSIVKLIMSIHDVDDGGLLCAELEMAIPGHVSFKLDFWPNDEYESALYHVHLTRWVQLKQFYELETNIFTLVKLNSSTCVFC